MRIKFSLEYNRGFRLLNSADQDLVQYALDLFQDDPHDPALANHPLGKPMIGQRAISAGDDLGIIFREKGDYIEVLMLDVGDHDRIY